MSNQSSLPDRAHNWTRLLLLFLILLAFTRLVWRLDAKNLWLDEGFSLQRAESPWPDLLRGLLIITDGVDGIDTIDQHPFGYFVGVGAMLRLAGVNTFALRFPSVMAATLLVPACWALARRLVRRDALPPAAPAWVALLAAASPFYLWYGQEARMYALVPLLAIVSTYQLLRWAEAAGSKQRRWWLAAYLITLIWLLCSHYFSVFILPVHAGIVYQRVTSVSRRRALLAAIAVLALGLLAVFPATWLMLRQAGAGSNFPGVTLRVLVPDLLNAFALGLSVNPARVWILDGLFGVIALLGMIWGVRSRANIAKGGWLLSAFVLVPTVLLLGVNAVRPAYLTARHMSLIGGAYLLLLSGGLAWLWRLRRWLGTAAGAVLLAGMIFSSINYYTVPAYEKGDLASMGQHLREQLQPGDWLLIEPSYMHRLYRYYLPIDAVETWRRAGFATGWRAFPKVKGAPTGLEEELQELSRQYRRIWLARSVPDSQVAAWLQSNAFRAQEWGYESPISFLYLELFVPQPPPLDGLPEDIQHPVHADFGDTISFRGYDIGQPFEPGYAVPITLYWQALKPPERHYKYILRWVVRGSDGVEQILATTEHEPYDGLLPTTLWTPGTTIREYSTILPPAGPITGQAYLTLQMYDAATLRKLPITAASGVRAGPDGETLILPLGQ